LVESQGDCGVDLLGSVCDGSKGRSGKVLGSDLIRFGTAPNDIKSPIGRFPCRVSSPDDKEIHGDDDLPLLRRLDEWSA